jgi:heme/copper-type cytochrome/quinol oxidase subunit 2
MGRVLAVIIWIVTLLSVLLFLSGKWWLPAAISNHAPALDRQFMITIIVVGISFTAAQVGLGWMVWKYRDTGKPADRALYSHGSNKLEVLWTVITAVVFITLGVMGQSVWAQLRLNDAPPGSYTVEVVAQQFQWNFHYPGKDNLFGRTDPKLIFTANKIGKYELACAELCGQLHFKMKSYMLVLPEDELTALQALPQEQFQARMGELMNKYPLPQY